jgi:hypothetical protein
MKTDFGAIKLISLESYSSPTVFLSESKGRQFESQQGTSDMLVR